MSHQVSTFTLSVFISCLVADCVFNFIILVAVAIVLIMLTRSSKSKPWHKVAQDKIFANSYVFLQIIEHVPCQLINMFSCNCLLVKIIRKITQQPMEDHSSNALEMITTYITIIATYI